ncbi:hypothetical protein Pint_27056 [Pistacia integerrima]|uniref:Uncharacterized protein n=1 Tax=Pistacia integerrima TaxID=434235 RepID=A0ACC0YP59_9ROSI|nr:hypothetical protein Pint_27056 [Pistacia integerrima]
MDTVDASCQEPVFSFNVSADGKLLPIQTTQGDVAIINSSNMQGFSFCIYGHKCRGNIDRGQEGKAVCPSINC